MRYPLYCHLFNSFLLTKRKIWDKIIKSRLKDKSDAFTFRSRSPIQIVRLKGSDFYNDKIQKNFIPLHANNKHRSLVGFSDMLMLK